MPSRTLRVLASALLVLALSARAAQAGPFSQVVFFGDSLSDTGNVFVATGGTTPTSPYFAGRFSNGPVWVEYLAAGLGLPSDSVALLQGGNNYAFGGARTDASASPVPGILAQVAGLWGPAHATADPDALYVLVAGGNDMRDARSAYTSDSAADQAGRQAAALDAIGDLGTALGVLASKGAKHVLVSTIPDLGQTPEAAALGLVLASTDASARFNALLPALMAAGAGLGLDMRLLDMAALGTAVRTDALSNGGAVYGITNVLTPCGSFTGSIGLSCDSSLFSDGLHPSARAHQLIGAAALAAVPEPAAIGLLALGLGVLARRRR